MLQHPPSTGGSRETTDCLVVIYTKEQTLLGKRFVLDQQAIYVGRGQGNHIVLDGESISRRHARFERRGDAWFVVDLGSINGTNCNDKRIAREVVLKDGDRVKIGPTLFKFLSGADVVARYHDEIYRMAIMDGLTQIYNKQYLHVALEREIVRSFRQEHSLSILMFDIDHLKRVNDVHGRVAGDFVLRSWRASFKRGSGATRSSRATAGRSSRSSCRRRRSTRPSRSPRRCGRRYRSTSSSSSPTPSA